jgi:hypothetical protein
MIGEIRGVHFFFRERDPVPLCSSRESVKAEKGTAKMTPIPAENRVMECVQTQ